MRRRPDPDRTFSYAEPVISEILGDGDLADGSDRMDAHGCGQGGSVRETVVEDGVDLFVRQPDGAWKIHISHAYTQ